MKEIALKSLKNTKVVTVILAIVCVVLLGVDIYQNNQFNRAIQQQTDSYKELMLAQQPDMQELPFQKLGRFKLSWYSPKELGKEKPEQLHTSTGKIPKEGRTIAVDPKLIPYGSIVYIQDYGLYVAEDCGGAIKGNRIDVFTASYSKALSMGHKVAQVWLIGKLP